MTEKEEKSESKTGGKKYTGGAIPKATKAAIKEMEEATKNEE